MGNLGKTMKTLILSICLCFTFLLPNLWARKTDAVDVVTSTKRIRLKEFSTIWNPSIVKVKHGFLLSFRYCLAPTYPWISYVGVVFLNDKLEPISTPQLLNTRDEASITSSQAEDARLVVFNNEIYLLYNDNVEVENPNYTVDRRDMYISKLSIHKHKVTLEKPLKLFHTEKYHQIRLQKNWVPFEWKGHLMLSYSLNPHEVVYPNLKTGECPSFCETAFESHWRWGGWRGGTPAQLVDGEYLAFFHSPNVTATEASKGILMYHYFMGAYTFSRDPPFSIHATSKEPIIAKEFYTQSSYDKRIIFPGGFVIVGSSIYLAYGKDDSEVWIAIIDKTKLKKSMKPVTNL
jgi:predicted GH43/DUF377 family glycosyl hydrolase